MKVMLDLAATFRTIVCGHLGTDKACPALATSSATTNIVADAANVQRKQSTQLVRAANVTAAWEDVERMIAQYREISANVCSFVIWPNTTWVAKESWNLRPDEDALRDR
jgi:hypothetical protein